jgi:ubiquinone/menaquinone biosynthesis C-methylase UbiE
MMETLTSCPICGGLSLSWCTKIKDHSITKEIFTISRCESCNFLFTNPRPLKEEIYKYYESPAYISHTNSKNGLFNNIYQRIRQFTIRKKLSLASHYAENDKSILDIGSGTGEFLNICDKNGWLTKGVEPNSNARNFSTTEYRLDVVNDSDLSLIPPNSFKIITMWHVLEHVHELKKRVNEIYDLLKDGGIAIIAVPNHESWDAAYYKTYWAAYDIPRHLYHFSPLNIKELFGQNNFEWIESIPMKFDSFYVSLLSEKYMGSIFYVLNAAYTGLKSNISAGKNPEKFSSTIYIFRKKS